MEIRVRNVNDAFKHLKHLVEHANETVWLNISPRGIATIEVHEPVLTHYACSEERVLFDPTRDANPFFHFFEALWILDGRSDVAFLAQFNSNIVHFSDDGVTFHAPYGHRMRVGATADCDEKEHDQLVSVIHKLRADHDTRQAVIQIWDHNTDLNALSRDIPCNDMIFFKIRDNKLKMRVMCRSNDIVWGGYGANVVQFSTLHEFVARAVGVEVGEYIQYSDSFHVYAERDDWKRIMSDGRDHRDPYRTGAVTPYPLLTDGESWSDWLTTLTECLNYMRPGAAPMPSFHERFFDAVAVPMYRAWRIWKDEGRTKNERIGSAVYMLETFCMASDWRRACVEWLNRRKEHVVR